jgi:leader peptidase (prepilin peptidase)/N-methyltransferase
MTVQELINLTFPVITPFVFALGACIGSFLNVVIWRLPRGESLSSPPSHCPKCNYRIKPWENIPIFGWLFLGGRCSNCREPIAIRYPLVELVTACLFLGVWLRVYHLQLPPSTLILFFFLAAAAVAISLIDIEHLIIPNRITYTGMLLALATAIFLPGSRVLPMAYAPQYKSGVMLERGLQMLPGELAASPRLAAAVDVLLGLALGWLVLWSALEAGKRIWGVKKVQLPGPTSLSLDEEAVVVGDAPPQRWQPMLQRKKDCFEAEVTDLHIRRRVSGAAEPEALVLAGTGSRQLTVTQGQVTAGDQHLPLSEVAGITATVSSYSIPREVMGLGDVKLLAMLGALLGMESLLFILLVSALAGCVLGTGLYLVYPPARQRPIPYGPFLMAGAMFWVFAGPQLVLAYEKLLEGI